MASETSSALYGRVTDRVLTALENGVAPWRRPWKAHVTATGERVWQPRNAITGRAYRGVNILLLAMSGFPDQRWVTFNQAKAAGGSVRKGERGTEVVFWKLWKTEKDDGSVSQVPLLRSFHVFNIAQVDGLTLARTDAESLIEPTTSEHIAAAEAITAGFVNRPCILHGGDRACYAPCLDRVTMPLYAQFESGEAYYATLFHELAHSTGHESRLDRPGVSGRAGEPRTLERYGREELIAEMTAAFLCAEAGIDGRLDQSAAYLENWRDAIRADQKAIVVAAGAAQKAADFILNRSPQEQSQEEGGAEPSPRETAVT
jgi:antirestriction protein ArdC